MKNRSEELQSLSKNEVEDEKLALQKALLYFENIHGRPVTKDEKGMIHYLGVQVVKPRVYQIASKAYLVTFTALLYQMMIVVPSFAVVRFDGLNTEVKGQKNFRYNPPVDKLFLKKGKIFI